MLLRPQTYLGDTRQVGSPSPLQKYFLRSPNCIRTSLSTVRGSGLINISNTAHLALHITHSTLGFPISGNTALLSPHNWEFQLGWLTPLHTQQPIFYQVLFLLLSPIHLHLSIFTGTGLDPSSTSHLDNWSIFSCSPYFLLPVINLRQHR